MEKDYIKSIKEAQGWESEDIKFILDIHDVDHVILHTTCLEEDTYRKNILESFELQMELGSGVLQKETIPYYRIKKISDAYGKNGKTLDEFQESDEIKFLRNFFDIKVFYSKDTHRVFQAKFCRVNNLAAKIFLELYQQNQLDRAIYAMFCPKNKCDRYIENFQNVKIEIYELCNDGIGQEGSYDYASLINYINKYAENKLFTFNICLHKEDMQREFWLGLKKYFKKIMFSVIVKDGQWIAESVILIRF